MMGVWIDEMRKTIPIKFDGVTGDTFNVRATNQADDKAHSTGPHKLQPDKDGVTTFVESFPFDFEGNVFVEITGSDGSRTEGVVSVY